MVKYDKLKHIKDDYIKSEDYCVSGKNPLANKNKFDEMMISYAEYITAVVEHVAFTEEFRGNGNMDTRIIMEEYNKKRTKAHNKAIMSTLGLNNELIKNGVIFDLDIVGKHKVEDFTSEQRREFGSFIFKMSAARSIIISERLKGKSEDKKYNDPVNEKTKQLERDYKVRITDDEEDIYKQVRKDSNFSR